MNSAIVPVSLIKVTDKLLKQTLLKRVVFSVQRSIVSNKSGRVLSQILTMFTDLATDPIPQKRIMVDLYDLIRGQSGQ